MDTKQMFANPNQGPVVVDVEGLKAERVQESLLAGAGSMMLRLKAERVQEPQSAAPADGAGYLYELMVSPLQPVSIALSGTSVVFTVHGTGPDLPGGPAGAN